MKYSIITPVYNRADCIARCLDSVIRNLRWGVELEHIVVDDGSCDDSPKIVRQYADKYPHIKLIPFTQNRGTNAARNAAIAAATGDYCIILDSDDYFVDDAVNIVNEVVTKSEYRHYFFMPNDMVDFHQNFELLKGKESTIITYEDLLFGRVDGDFIHVIRTPILKKYPFDEDLRINEAVFFQRMHKEERNVLFTNKIVTIRERGRGDSVSLTCSRADKKALERSIKATRYWIDWFGDDMLISQEGRDCLYKLLKRIFDYSLILSDYKAAEKALKVISENSLGSLPHYLTLIYKVRLGWLYRFASSLYVTLRNR